MAVGALTVVGIGLGAASAQAATTLTSGTLTDATGSASAGKVRVYAWPYHSGSMTLPLVGTAQAGPDGRFTVTADDERQLARLSEQRDGYLDLTAVADVPGHEGEWTFTVFVTAPQPQMRALEPTAMRSAALGRTPLVARAPKITIRAATPAPARASQIAGDPQVKCKTERQVLKPQSRRSSAIVGEFNNAYNDGTSGRFTYAESSAATTKFGVAISRGDGSFGISGENLVTNEGTLKFRTVRNRYARKLRSEFEFTREGARNSTCAKFDIRIRATAWIGGGDDRLRQKSALDRCDPKQIKLGYKSGMSFSRSTGSAVRWTRGATAFGVDLTSQTEYGKSTTLSYDFRGPRDKKHLLCGPDGKESPVTAGRVFSGARK